MQQHTAQAVSQEDEYSSHQPEHSCPGDSGLVSCMDCGIYTSWADLGLIVTPFGDLYVPHTGPKAKTCISAAVPRDPPTVELFIDVPWSYVPAHSFMEMCLYLLFLINFNQGQNSNKDIQTWDGENHLLTALPVMALALPVSGGCETASGFVSPYFISPLETSVLCLRWCWSSAAVLCLCQPCKSAAPLK